MDKFGTGNYSIVITWKINGSETQYFYETVKERDDAYKRHNASSKTSEVIKKDK